MATLFYLTCILFIAVIWMGRCAAIKREFTLAFTDKGNSAIHLKMVWNVILLFAIDIAISVMSLAVTGGGNSIFGLQILITVNAFTTVFGKYMLKVSLWYGRRAVKAS